MIVVDTNVIGYLYLEGRDGSLAERVWMKDSEWVAPLLWRSELRNVLALYLRKRWLTLRESLEIMAAATGMMEGREYEADSLDVLQLVTKSKCSAYDCEFVALAQELRVPLVTADKQILRDFPSLALSLTSFVDTQ